MTPRQVSAYLQLAARRKNIESAHDLNLNAIAAQGDGKTIQSTTKTLLKE